MLNCRSRGIDILKRCEVYGRGGPSLLLEIAVVSMAATMEPGACAVSDLGEGTQGGMRRVSPLTRRRSSCQLRSDGFSMTPLTSLAAVQVDRRLWDGAMERDGRAAAGRCDGATTFAQHWTHEVTQF